jgi:hypothetical protein
MSDQSAPMEQTTTPDAPTQDGDQQAPAQPDHNARLLERLDQLSGGFSQLQEQFQTVQQRLDQPADEPDDDWQLEPDDPGYEEQEAQRAISDLRTSIADELRGEFSAQQAQRDADQAYGQLVQRYPALNDEKVAGPLVQQAANLIEQLNPQAVHTPVLVQLTETLYKAHVADQRAAAGDACRVAPRSPTRVCCWRCPG